MISVNSVDFDCKGMTLDNGMYVLESDASLTVTYSRKASWNNPRFGISYWQPESMKVIAYANAGFSFNVSIIPVWLRWGFSTFNKDQMALAAFLQSVMYATGGGLMLPRSDCDEIVASVAAFGHSGSIGRFVLSQAMLFLSGYGLGFNASGECDECRLVCSNTPNDA